MKLQEFAIAFVCVIAVLIVVGMVVKEVPINNDIEAQVLAMPNSAFRSNLLTVLGAQYGDSSEELNEILQMYSKMKIAEMSNKGDL